MTVAMPQHQQQQPPQEWFYSDHGQPRGPGPIDTLRAMLAGGQVLWTEMVWSAGMPNWVPASTVAQLKPLPPSAAAGGPPPLPPQAINYAGPPMPGERRDIGENAGMRLLIPV